MATDGIVDLEAWGGKGGNPWSHKVIGQILNIIITYDANGINSIKFISKDGTGQTSDESGVFGVEKGTKKEITIDSTVEKLISIEGSFGTYNSVQQVTSLGFTTTKTVHEPVGLVKVNSEFSCLVSENPITGFHGNCSTVLNSIGISIGVVTSMEVAGPWPTSESGAAFDYTSKGPISQISVSYDDDIICSLQFTSLDADGVPHTSPLFGKSEGRKYMEEILIDTKVEKIIGINGAYGPYANTTLVKSLTFITDSKRSIGPFGAQKPEDTPFSFSVGSGNRLVGFHGRSGWYIDSIGVHKQTVGSAKVGPYSPSNVGSPWSYEPQGFISRMFGDYRGTFHIVQFESIDENGVKHTSDRFGTYEYTKYSVDADKGNRIIGISGTCRKPDIESILCYVHIYTNKKAHGPFGDANGGTNFSFKVKNGYVSGFHGRSERAINAIGIYVKPA